MSLTSIRNLLTLVETPRGWTTLACPRRVLTVLIYVPLFKPLTELTMKFLQKILSCISITSLLCSGCNKDELKDLNINPQALNTIDVNFLFSSAQLGAASGGSRGDDRYIDWRTNIGITS